MKRIYYSDETIGAFVGQVANEFRSPDMMEWLERVPALVNSADAVVLTDGRNRNIRLEADCHGKVISVVVKAFGKPSLLKNSVDRSGRGSKARRTWTASVHLNESGVGTPAPVAFLERWVENRLVESYVITLYLAGFSDFRTELNSLFRIDPECSKFISLMQVVADGIRSMHDAGFLHNDLGNQNIMLRHFAEDEEWGNVQFIDLNRGRIRESLSNRDRARDISRIYLPSDFLRVFVEMYFGKVPPKKFMKLERVYRARYARHAKSRCWRHPVREWKKRRDKGLELRSAIGEQGNDNIAKLSDYPEERDIWVWDELSGQAQTVLLSRDKKRYYSKSWIWNVVGSSLKALFPVWREYRQLLKGAYSEPVEMKERIGVSIEVVGERLERQLELLSGLGSIPVFVRFYHHRSDAERSDAVDAVKRLHRAGHSVGIALVQDRIAVRNPGAWHVFVEEVMGDVGDIVNLVEIGHAINRVKWGLWGLGEYRQLVAGVAAIKLKYPQVTFSGPAVIDFDYPYVVAALARLPEKFRFGALSHHLYVDRRGAPENRQGNFAALEKFAFGRAIARWSDNCDDRFVVSEVNWPVEGTGVYSPVGSPYVSPGERLSDPSVSEDDYADFMLRYLLIALCSGFVERVYWWRLAAYGYGIVDDSDEDQLRERVAYKMLKVFLDWVGDARFVKRLELNDDGAVAFEFGERKASEEGNVGSFWLAYTSGDECELKMPFAVSSAVDALGEPVDVRGDGVVKLSGRVVFLK